MEWLIITILIVVCVILFMVLDSKNIVIESYERQIKDQKKDLDFWRSYCKVK